jgi:hypothetical protein
MFADEFLDKHPREWMKEVFITSEEVMEAYVVEVSAKFHC